MFFDLAGPAGRLEALYHAPHGARFCAAVCHPHPLYGGTLHNHATYRIAKAVEACGGATLRFNFRGVGRSQGKHDQGVGEVEDVRAALAWLARKHPDLPRLACGFSFGARAALQAGCSDDAVKAVLACGLAVRMFDVSVVTSCPKRVAVVQAEHDEYGTPAEVAALLERASAPRRLAVVPAATHLFTQDLGALQKEAEAAVFWLLGEAAAAPGGPGAFARGE